MCTACELIHGSFIEYELRHASVLIYAVFQQVQYSIKVTVVWYYCCTLCMMAIGSVCKREMFPFLCVSFVSNPELLFRC